MHHYNEPYPSARSKLLSLSQQQTQGTCTPFNLVSCETSFFIFTVSLLKFNFSKNSLLYQSTEYSKTGDTLSSRDVSSCDVRVQLGCERRFDIEFYGADPHFCHSAYVTWSHVSRNMRDNRNMRGLLAREPTRAPREITWRKQSDRSVNLRHRIQCQIASHIPTARVTSYEFTSREDSVSPVLVSPVQYRILIAVTCYCTRTSLANFKE